MGASSADKFGSPQAAALYQAAARGDTQRAQQLMAQGASLNSSNAQKQTLLKVAILEGNRRAFEGLLALGADPAYLGDARDTAMHLAAWQEQPYWLKTLLEKGAPTEPRNGLGETPLFSALGQEANVQLLLKAKADVHAVNNAGDTLLHKAAMTMNLAQVPKLLALGVDPRATNRFGNTFQFAFFKTPESRLSSEAKAIRQDVREWLRARGIPVEDKGQR